MDEVFRLGRTREASLLLRQLLDEKKITPGEQRDCLRLLTQPVAVRKTQEIDFLENLKQRLIAENKWSRKKAEECLRQADDGPDDENLSDLDEKELEILQNYQQ